MASAKGKGATKKKAKDQRAPYRRLVLNFLVLTINLILIVLYFSLSEATIVISPSREEFTHTSDIPITDEITPSGNRVHGSIETIEIITEKTISITDTYPKESQARGAVIVHNITPNRSQSLVKNTRFANEDGVVIRINEAINIAPGESIAVEAYADEPGISGEVSEGRFQIVALPYLKDQIYAELKEPFSGGMQEVGVFSQAAYDDAVEQITEHARQEATEELVTAFGDRARMQTPDIEILEIKADAEIGDEVLEVIMIARAAASVMIFDDRSAYEIAKNMLIENIPEGMIVKSVEPGFKTIIPDPEHNRVRVTVAATIQARLKEVALNTEDIIGMDESELKNYFARMNGVHNVNVAFKPFWVRSVPNLKDNIHIQIQQD